VVAEEAQGCITCCADGGWCNAETHAEVHCAQEKGGRRGVAGEEAAREALEEGEKAPGVAGEDHEVEGEAEGAWGCCRERARGHAKRLGEHSTKRLQRQMSKGQDERSNARAFEFPVALGLLYAIVGLSLFVVVGFLSLTTHPSPLTLPPHLQKTIPTGDPLGPPPPPSITPPPLPSHVGPVGSHRSRSHSQPRVKPIDRYVF
jgi:hypothetical protein